MYTKEEVQQMLLESFDIPYEDSEDMFEVVPNYELIEYDGFNILYDNYLELEVGGYYVSGKRKGKVILKRGVKYDFERLFEYTNLNQSEYIFTDNFETLRIDKFMEPRLIRRRFLGG